MKTVKQIMSPALSDIAYDDPLSKAVLWMHKGRHSCVLVCQSGQLSGILTERDVVRIYASRLEGKLPHDVPIAEVMTRELICVQGKTKIHEALVIANNCKVRHLPVVDEKQNLLGIVTQNDILSEYLNSIEVSKQLKTDIESLKALSLEDPMLGTGNRRALDIDLAKTQSASERYGNSYAIAMFDVDFFKRYNDRYGHQQGDEALKLVVDIIRTNMREADRVYRYGGEEFLLLMPQTTGEQAIKVSERIRQKIQTRGLPHDASDIGVLTISAGVAATVGDWSAALNRADKALYHAKHSGRNTALLWEPSFA